MEYVQLGKSDLKVSKICLGCMSFGEVVEGGHTWVLNQEKTDEMIKKALGVQKGSSNAGTTTVGTLSADKLKEIAEYKMPDLNAYDLDAAMKIVAGTAKNMGVKVEGIDA